MLMHAVVYDAIDSRLLLQKTLIGFLFRVRDVVMQIAVPDMAEGHHARTRECLLQQCVSRADKVADMRNRNRHIMLDVLAFRCLRQWDVFTEIPDRL